MTAVLQAVELIAQICAALSTAPDLLCEGGRIFGPEFPGRRRPRKPWRIGIDPVDFAAVLQVARIDAAWMPLAGGTQADGLEMIVDSINAHCGIELSPAMADGGVLRAPSAADLDALGPLTPDGAVSWSDLATRLAAA